MPDGRIVAGRYRVLDGLGRGGVGVVRRAERPRRATARWSPPARRGERTRVTSLDGDPSNDRGARVSCCHVRSTDGSPLLTSVTGS